MAALAQGFTAERHAVAVVQATATLSREDRAEVDRRLAGVIGRLGVQAAGRAAGRVAAEVDAASVVCRMERAVSSRRVSVRPAPDGMGVPHRPLFDEGRGGCTCRPAGSVPLRRRGPVPAGAARRPGCGSRRLGHRAGVAVGTGGRPAAAGGGAPRDDRPGVVGVGDHARSVMEPARIPGHGSVRRGRAHLAAGEAGRTEARRTCVDVGAPVVHDPGRARPGPRWTHADGSSPGCCAGCCCCATTCAPPRCGAAIAHADHATPTLGEGGATDFAEGNGKRVRCNGTRRRPAGEPGSSTAAIPPAGARFGGR